MKSNKTIKQPQNRKKTGRKPNGQFAPGASGNPGGRPKTKHVSEAARNWLAAAYARSPRLTNAEALVEFLGAQAFAGDIASSRLLVEYAEGKAPASVSVAIDERMRSVIESGLAALVATGLSETE